MGAPLYQLVKPFVRKALHVYYKRVESTGLNDAIPEKSPVILISNHQNALIDPILVCVSVERQVHYLARASAFKNPFVSFVLKQLNMLPVFRLRDNVKIHQANEEVFNETTNRLVKNEIIGIFPEGNHGGRRKLRPMKKGFSRIAWRAMQNGADPYILPVGIDYTSHYTANASVSLIPGTGFYSSEFKHLSEVEFHKAMAEKAKEVLLDSMLETRMEKSDKIIWRLDRLKWDYPRFQQLEVRQEMARRLDEMENSKRDEVHRLVKSLDKQLKAYNNDLTSYKESVGFIPKVLFYGGKAIFFPIQSLVNSLSPQLVKDAQFTATIAFVLYLVLIPVYVLLLAAVVYAFGGWSYSLFSVLIIMLFMWLYRIGVRKSSFRNKVPEKIIKKIDSDLTQLRTLIQ